MSMKPSPYFRLHWIGRAFLILITICVSSLLTVSQSSPIPSETSSNSATVSPTPTVSPWATDTAEVIKALANGWPLLATISVIVIIIWLRKDIKALFQRASTDSSTVKFAGVELQMTQRQKESQVHDEKEINQTDSEVDEPPSATNSGEGGDLSQNLSAETGVSGTEETENWLERLFEISNNSRDLEEMQRVFDGRQSDETEINAKTINEVVYNYLRFKAGDKNAIAALERLAENTEVKSDAYKWIARCYMLTDDYLHAIEAYEVSIESASDEISKAKLVVIASDAIFKSGNQDGAANRILKAIKSANLPDTKAVFYKALADLYKQDDKKELKVLALEKALEFADTDLDILFNLAYAYAENGQHILSWRTYQNLLTFDPKNSAAFNNLGVEYKEFGMSVSMVYAYEQAIALGNTLASANLATKVGEAGLINQARQILAEAKGVVDVHQNVLRTEAELAKKEEEESERKEQMAVLAARQRQFVRGYAEAYWIGNAAIDISGKWKFGLDDYVWEPFGTFVHIDGNAFPFEKRIEGVFNRESRKIKVETHNQSLKITTMKQESVTYSKELVWRDSNDKGKGYMSSDGTTIWVMMDKESESQFWEITRLTPQEVEELKSIEAIQ